MNQDLDNLKVEINRLKHAYLDLKEEMSFLIRDQQSASMTRKRGALATAGVTCESLLKFVYKNEGLEQGARPAHSLMLEDLIHKLSVVLPPHIMINVRTIQAWRNMGAHDKGDFRDIDDFTISQVEHSLNSVVNWFFVNYLNEELNEVKSPDISKNERHSPSTSQNSKSSVFNANDIIGYYETEIEPLMLESWKITYYKSRTNFGEQNLYAESLRFTISPINREIAIYDGEDISEQDHEESFLLVGEGSWHLEDNHVIHKFSNINIQPEPLQTFSKRIVELFSDTSKESIERIESKDESLLKLVAVNDSSKQTELRKLHYLTKRVDEQENEKWLNQVTQVIEDRQLTKAMENLEAFFDGHIDKLSLFVNDLLRSMNGDYTNCVFNGELTQFDNGWKPLKSNLLSNYGIPEHILQNVIIVGGYLATVGSFFSKRNIEVFFAAYSNGFMHEEDENGNLVQADRYLLANLLFVKSADRYYAFSLSCWIGEYREIPCISAINLDGNTIFIDGYKQFARNKSEAVQFEIVLDARINSVIKNFYDLIQEYAIM